MDDWDEEFQEPSKPMGCVIKKLKQQVKNMKATKEPAKGLAKKPEKVLMIPFSEGVDEPCLGSVKIKKLKVPRRRVVKIKKLAKLKSKHVQKIHMGSVNAYEILKALIVIA